MPLHPALLLIVAMLGTGMGAAWMVGHNAMAIGRRLRLLDHPDPSGRKHHTRVTPLVGGVALTVALVLCGGAIVALVPDPDARLATAWIVLSVLASFMVGAADDRFELGPFFRLGAASAILLFAVLFGPGFQVGGLIFTGQAEPWMLPGPVGIGFTLLCLVGLQNAVNMADGKNGLVIGQALIWTAVLGVRLPPDMLPLLAGIAGCLVVLFAFNMKGKLFLGDGGSYGLATAFGLLAIHAWNRGDPTMRSDDIALIFALPVFDTLRLMVWRVMQGRTPFTPGRDHLHHYLHARWGWPRPLPWVLALVALPNLFAVLFPGTALYWLGLTLGAYVLMLFVALRRVPARYG